MLTTRTVLQEDGLAATEIVRVATAPRRWRWLRGQLARLAGLVALFCGRRLRARIAHASAILRARVADQRGSQITDNLGLVVIGIVAIVAIGGLISGLDKTVFNWVTQQLGLG